MQIDIACRRNNSGGADRIHLAIGHCSDRVALVVGEIHAAHVTGQGADLVVGAAKLIATPAAKQLQPAGDDAAAGSVFRATASGLQQQVFVCAH